MFLIICFGEPKLEEAFFVRGARVWAPVHSTVAALLLVGASRYDEMRQRAARYQMFLPVACMNDTGLVAKRMFYFLIASLTAN